MMYYIGRRGRPRKTWRRTIEEEITEMGKTWREVKTFANQRKDGGASQEPYVPSGTKGIKSSKSSLREMRQNVIKEQYKRGNTNQSKFIS
jgi:hypothetical protein